MSIQQGQHTWNGQSWVPIAANSGAVGTGSYSTYTYSQGTISGSHQVPGNMNPASVPAVMNGSNIPGTSMTQSKAVGTKESVESYSKGYHYWIEQSKTKKKEAASLPPGPEKDEALRVAGWADYYAGQCAHAAHYYKNSMDQQQSQQYQQQPQQHNPSFSTSSHTPGSSFSYASLGDRNKQGNNYNGKNNNKTFGSAIGSVIDAYKSSKRDEKQVKNGSTQASQWSNDKFIQTSSSASNNITNISHSSFNSDSTDFPPLSSKSKKKHNKKETLKNNAEYLNAMPENDSYYGHASSQTSKTLGNIDDKHFNDVARENNRWKTSQPDMGEKNSTNPFSKSTRKRKLDESQVYKSADSSQQDPYKPRSNVVSLTKKNPSKKTLDGFERSKKILAKRANRFSTGVSSSSSFDGSDNKNGGKKTDKSEKNFDRYMGLSVIGGGSKKRNGKLSSNKKLFNLSSSSFTDNEKDYEKMTVKGTCKKLEKEYLRLTSPPRAELVRPQPVLEKHLSNLKQNWKNNRNVNGYTWLCSQLKAVRQDLTVQRINNSFAVEVYETHARIALEQGDLNEYNQCQTQLKDLYMLLEHQYNKRATENINSSSCHGLSNENEFIAYRIIYYVFLTGNEKYEGGSSDLFNIMLSLTCEQKEDPCIKHALKVRLAFTENDYHTFFKLHFDSPKMGAYLMDYMVPPLRLSALQRICKAYRPNVSLRFVLSELGFNVDEKEDLELGVKWIRSCGGVVSEDNEKLLTKESVISKNDEGGKKNSLI